jgi:hypothetical protein
MSEILGNHAVEPQEVTVPEPGTAETDVQGVFADDTVNHGVDKFPVFNVDKNVYMNNMHNDRKRLRFPSELPVTQYMRNTKYNRPFFVQYTEDSGKTYRRKVK